ncbi:elongation factor P maturation arginine rhamnosyltransferase EarP [Treponema sp.]|uniref:elongation factor P maturation arginine rhamnosyltransferase EarP n=1 Tax=Treponema sp. TaxID=166 RepID=UPI0038904AF2
MFNKNNILILCKVVDNFGDIGVVYRLARALSDLNPSLELTLVVSNLESFKALAPQIDSSKQIQNFLYKNTVWKVVDWNLKTENSDLGLLEKSGFPFSIILECFQCGRPDWLENILFSPDFNSEVQILQIDYLTAEDYAEEFHLLKSGTRKANIKKRFFMPGFTEKTGGLIINEKQKTETVKLSVSDSQFSIFYFAYEDDCTAVVKSISEFQEIMQKKNPEFCVTVYLASGKSSSPFENACKKSRASFLIEKVPFLPQQEFDEFILKMDFLFVRGEDSLARACLSSIPFVWQAYKQDENYQLVKVNALLSRMEVFFKDEEFEPVKKFWQSYNDYETQEDSQSLTEMLLDTADKKNTEGFKNFAAKLYQNGNLASHLLEFIGSL